MQRRHFFPIAFLASLALLSLPLIRESETASAVTAPQVPVCTPQMLDNPQATEVDFGLYLQPPATIQSWIFTPTGKTNNSSIRQHGWSLWNAINQPLCSRPGKPDYPIWESWYSREEVYQQYPPDGPPPNAQRPRIRGLEAPNQVNHGPAPAQTRVLSGVKYNPAAAEFVWQNGYYAPARLNEINGAWRQEPLSQRGIEDFPRQAVTLKPTYWLVKQSGTSLVPFWVNGSPAHSTDPVQPDAETWKDFVAVSPSQGAGGQVSGNVPRRDADGNYSDIPYTAPIVAINSDFYAFQLDQDEVDYLTNPPPGTNPIINGALIVDGSAVVDCNEQSGSDPRCSFQVGDYLVLAGMHTTTKEIDNWTWQTFWYTPDPSANPDSQDQPSSITGVWTHYAMATSYFESSVPGDPSSANHVAFNPYLELDLGPEGKSSNCMSCHSVANWPAVDLQKSHPGCGYPVCAGPVDPGDPALFTGNTKSDFLWSMPLGAAANEK